MVVVRMFFVPLGGVGEDDLEIAILQGGYWRLLFR